ncbi:MAG: DedA family protein [Simkaniaceae bacterium]|nr:DedA family protein [Simkaniaceae bacterium]
MDYLFEIIAEHRSLAPWITFGLILLAGINLPISIDILIIINALLAAHTIPEYTYPLYFSILFGCYFSAWISYYIGRKFGRKLVKYKWFAKILCEKKLKKVNAFYSKHGLLTLTLGRFIPCGVRNCIFMTTGMSELPFKQFILRDALACFLWTSTCFYLYYNIGLNYQILIYYVKTFNILIFSTIIMTLIGVLWYKKKGKKTLPQPEKMQKNDDY